MISVVIPTHNRQAILKKCLEALSKQTLSSNEFEVIIVNDGSTDDTKKLIEHQQKKTPLKIHYCEQANLGQGTARNLGIKQATGEITLLIGDDIIASPDLLAEHQKIHQSFPLLNHAVLGFIDWHPDLKITSFMKWLTNGSCILGKYGGHQFAFEKLANQTEADYNFFYTSNISLKTSLLKANPFDSNFTEYGWEDIELGYRLSKSSHLKIHYNFKAIAYHFHPLDLSSLAPRMRQIGRSSYLINDKYPELKKIPSFSKKLAFKIISNPLSLGVLKVGTSLFPSQTTRNYYYYALSKKYFLEGLKK